MVFQTGSGKKIVFNDMKLGVTANKTWKGRKDNQFLIITTTKNIKFFIGRYLVNKIFQNIEIKYLTSNIYLYTLNCI